MVLTLRELQGCSYEEVADILKCSVNAVKSRLNRAREAFKQAYTDKFGPPQEEFRNKTDVEFVKDNEENL